MVMEMVVVAMTAAACICLAKDSAKSSPCIISFYLYNHVQRHVLQYQIHRSVYYNIVNSQMRRLRSNEIK